MPPSLRLTVSACSRIVPSATTSRYADSAHPGSVKRVQNSVPIKASRVRPVNASVAALTSLIRRSEPMVTSGSICASIRVRRYSPADRRAFSVCFCVVISLIDSMAPATVPFLSYREVALTQRTTLSPFNDASAVSAMIRSRSR